MNNILVIEDDPIQRKALITTLSEIANDFNLIVYEADSKVSAFDVLSKYLIGLIFVDIELKDGSGLDFIKSLRKLPV